MKNALALLVSWAALLAVGCSAPRTWIAPETARLEEVATSDRRWTGLAVSREGRVFVNYPRWSPSQPFAVGELQPDGTVRPFPDATMNGWEPGLPPSDHFVCVQAMVVDAKNRLWILDPGNPEFKGVIEGAPKLVVIDLDDDRVLRTYRFDPAVVPGDGYLNDLRVDLRVETVYMTDSGNGALIVLDTSTGAARRLLDEHPSVHAEDIDLAIGGRPWQRDGRTPRVHADGIALSDDGKWLYYQALTGRTLYRVATAHLRDARLHDVDLGRRVERVAESGASDGLLYGRDGCIYVSALEHDAIRRVTPHGTVETVIHDDRIAWPDSFAVGPGAVLHFTTARIHEGDQPRGPFAIYRVKNDSAPGGSSRDAPAD